MGYQGGIFINLEIVRDFYEEQLYKTPPAYDWVRTRTLSQVGVMDFNLGYAPNNNALTNWAKQRGLDVLDFLYDQDLVRQGSDASYYDTFRDRIVFPITSPSGKVVGFSSRSYLPTDTGAKYINSRTNDTFSKGRLLYNLSQASPHVVEKGFVYLVEGFFDVIALHEHELFNVVASMGTAFTTYQAQLLKKYTNRVCIMFDGDKAGLTSMDQTAQLLIRQGFDVKVITLPEGHDPDTAIKEFGLSIIKQKHTYYQYIFYKTYANFRKTNPYPTNEDVLDFFSFLKGAPRKDYYPIMLHVCADLGVDRAALHIDLKQKYGVATFDLQNGGQL